VGLLDEHIGYVADDRRLACFRRALVSLVRPGDVVADVGCGTGILGLLCLQAGAAKVWGIESTAMTEVAREAMARAGLGDRYACIRGHSLQVELPQPVDIAICDHVGFFGFDYDIIATLGDARRRFLKPGGRIVPSRIRLQLGAVQSPRCRDKAEAWRAVEVPSEYRWLRDFGINTKLPMMLTPDEILGEPAILGTIDLGADNPPFLSFQAELRVARDGVLDGVAGWFECELSEGIWMTNSPLSGAAIAREQAFLPIDQPLAVKAGEILNVSIMARPAGNLIAWTLEARASGRRFNHSAWKGLVLAPEDIVRFQPDRVPRLSRAGLARRIVMEYCDGRRTNREIEQEVLRDHPQLFPSREAISSFILGALGRDSE